MNYSEKTKEQLIEELNLLRTLIDTLPDRIFVKDTKGRFIICNKAVVDAAEISPLEGITGKSDFDIYPPEKAGQYYRREQEIITTGQPMVNEEVCGIHPATGEPWWSLSTKIPWRNESGEIIGIIGANREITGWKKIEEALKESERRYKAIFEAAREGILVAEIETRRFKYANPAICKMLGYTAEELQEMDVQDIHPRESLPQISSEFEAQARGEKTLVHNIPCLRKNGTIFYADINTTNVVIDQTPCNVGLFTDITHRKQAEDALRESEQRYRLLVEQLPAITYTAALDETSTTLYVSPQVRQILGVTSEDYRSDPDLWMKLVHPEDRKRVMDEIAKSHRTGRPFSSEYRMTAKDGHIVWIRDDARIVKDSSGKPSYLQGVMYDITESKKAAEELQKARADLEARVQQRTAALARAIKELQKEIAERKRAEVSLRQAEERFRTIFENAVVGIYRTTPDGQILMANPALIKLMGYKSLEELAQLNLEKEGFDPSSPRSIFKQRIEKEGSVNGLESIWIKRDGTRLFVSENAFAVRDAEGKILYYEGTAQDITQRKEAEEKLIIYQQHLRSLAAELSLAEERLKRKIAADLHDNISQNLAISKMKLDSLAQNARPEQVAPLKEVTDLIAQTIEVSRTLTFEMSPPVLYELGFEAAIGWLVNQTRQRFGIKTGVLDDGKPKLLNDDVKVLLFTAVRELLTNVVKHAKARSVKVSIQAIRNKICIIVEDNGVGFDAAGTNRGFGLFNICERLDYIGGRVEIDTGAGRGTRVTLLAPLLKSKKKNSKIRKNRRQE
ncbi:MAG: PAS domain S-box protein [Sedimentisphaerales bacterium]|nr:PAS domain S-box protein [Sedimentisphaerales bacterium]